MEATVAVTGVATLTSPKATWLNRQYQTGKSLSPLRVTSVLTEGFTDKRQPVQYLLQSLPDGGFQLRQPLDLAITPDEFGAFIASDERTVVYGYGVDVAKAIRDYAASLVEYFMLINSAGDEEQISQIREILVPVTR